MQEISEAQQSVQKEYRGKNVLIMDEKNRVLMNNKDQIWIPTQNIAKRIMIIAHCGSGGHRGFDSTKKVLLNDFFWKDSDDDLRFFFLSSCLNCLQTLPGTVPRPHIWKELRSK
jgi:hypothetical protein